MFACADPEYQISIRVYTELPWAALFVNNMFIGVPANKLDTFKAEWTILHAPSFFADPIIDQTNAIILPLFVLIKKKSSLEVLAIQVKLKKVFSLF